MKKIITLLTVFAVVLLYGVSGVAFADAGVVNMEGSDTDVGAFVADAAPGVQNADDFVADAGAELNGGITVGGEKLDAPAPYIHAGTGAVMVPLRAVAEKLGYKLIWEQEEEKIILGYGIQLWIGRGVYITDFTDNINIDPAPEITGGRTFVPVDFIKNTLGYEVNVSEDAVVIGDSTSSTLWITHDGAVSWFSENAPFEHCSDREVIQVGKDPDGGDVFALLRMTLRGDWFADEVSGARMYLKIAEEGAAPPGSINVGTAANSWAPATVERDFAKTVIREDSFVLTELRIEDDGWVSLDVTDVVKSWLGGEIPNRGFVLFPGAEDDEALGVFVSGTPGETQDLNTAPRIIIEAEIGDRSDTYGRFGFTKQPEQGVADPIFGGNCLSYAIRDIDTITFDDLPFDFDELNRLFFESGQEGVLEYSARLIEDYIEENKAGLQISGFRRIDDFDSPIDAVNEYRIILRTSANATPQLPMSERGGYDFHLWAQLSDGRWTQKSPSVFSSILPGTGPGISPLKFYWDAGDVWGIERWQEWYRSGGIYYAVTKDTDEFTSHKKTD